MSEKLILNNHTYGEKFHAMRIPAELDDNIFHNFEIVVSNAVNKEIKRINYTANRIVLHTRGRLLTFFFGDPYLMPKSFPVTDLDLMINLFIDEELTLSINTKIDEQGHNMFEIKTLYDRDLIYINEQFPE